MCTDSLSIDLETNLAYSIREKDLLFVLASVLNDNSRSFGFLVKYLLFQIALYFIFEIVYHFVK